MKKLKKRRYDLQTFAVHLVLKMEELFIFVGLKHDCNYALYPIFPSHTDLLWY